MEQSFEEKTIQALESLERLAGSLEGQLLLAAPVVILALIILIYVVVVAVKRRRERDALLKDMELPDSAEASESGLVTAFPEEAKEQTQGERRLEGEKALPDEVDEIRRSDRESWIKRLGSGLAKTRASLEQSLGGLFSGKVKIDDETLEKLHEGLFRADVGVTTADKLVDHVRKTLSKEEAADWDQVSRALKDRAAALMESSAPSQVARLPSAGPLVILVVGVNGVGKTTSIGKLAAHFLAQDKKVLLAAGDTFRAAAIEQLQVWADRLGVPIVKHKQGADPAAVAYDAVKAAVSRGVDVLLIDTAGRLHSKADLMKELGKINKVVGKDLPGAPHETWLVIDATTGQNAFQQVKAFKEVVELTGLVVTKLDGTAKGGVLIGVADQFQLPIRYIGVGEKAVDLRTFDPKDYVESLF